MVDKRLILLTIFIAILSLSCVNAQDDEANITSLDDASLVDNANLSAGQKSFSDLNKLISETPYNTINLYDDYSFDLNTDSEFINGIEISHSVNIVGNGHTLDGGSQARIFNVTSYAVFKNIVFTNAKSDTGSAISGSNFAVYDSSFTNNVATDIGGALNGGYVVNSTFIGNSAGNSGGAMYKGSVDGCTFIENSAGDSGGAIYEVYATKSVFENNIANYGGAMRASSAGECIFIANTAKIEGGAVFKAYLNNCTFRNNSAYGSGGAIGGDQNSAVNCLFEYNTANYGGAVYGYVVYDSIFRNNRANNGGAMYTGSARDCIFVYNYAIDEGGALMSAYAENCNFTFNHALKGGAMFLNSAKNCTFQNNSALEGGAMYNSHSISGKFYYNSATTGGAIYNGSADSSTFRYNYAVNGGATALSDVLDCILESNTATQYGGAGYQTSARRSVFQSNTANIGGGLAISSSASGSFFIKNVAKVTGGAKYDTYVVDSKFEGNLPKYKLYVSDFTALEGFGGDFFVNLYDSSAYPVKGVNATIKIYDSKNKLVKTQIVECGYSWFVSLSAGTYKAVVSIADESYEITPVSASITIKKTTSIYVVSVTTNYNAGKSLIINLHDSSGVILKYSKVSVTLNGATKSYSTDANGQVIISTKRLIPNTYTVKISYAGTTTYEKSSATAKIVVKKLTPKFTAAKKTFKLKDKTKKYTVTLKTNKNVVMKNTKITIKVKGKTYSAKTNSKGIATFKFTKLTKKGTFNAVITYAGDKIYNKLTKTVKITVKK